MFIVYSAALGKFSPSVQLHMMHLNQKKSKNKNKKYILFPCFRKRYNNNPNPNNTNKK